MPTFHQLIALLTPPVLGGAIGSVLTFLGKWWFDQWTERLKARRTFNASVADSVIKLADDHYWKLATDTGVLARLLQEIGRERALYLTLVWETRGELADQLDLLASENARRTFGPMVQVVCAFQDFQFTGSNTYLLTRHSAGENCKRLYNAFVENLSDDLQKKLPALYLKEVQVSERGAPVFRRPAELPAASLPLDQFEQEVEALKLWLRHRPDQVQRAADALRAYAEILTAELADLYGSWLGRGSTAGSDRWGVLSDDSRRTLALVGSSTLYRPLGGSMEVAAPATPPSSAKAGGPDKSQTSSGSEAPTQAQPADQAQLQPVEQEPGR